MENKRILLVDDDEMVIETAGGVLQNTGYRVTAALSGEEALVELSHQNFHLVITDLVMGAMSGIDMLHHVRQIQPQAQVMILTAFGTLNSAVEALQLGAVDYLLKPWQRDDLLFRVSNVFEKMEMRQRLATYENMLPVCCVCHSIRDDETKGPGKGEWLPLTEFVRKNGLEVSHTYCPTCYQRYLNL